MIKFSGKHRKITMFFNDSVSIILGYIVATLLVYERSMLPNILYDRIPLFGFIMLLSYLISFKALNIDSILWSYANMRNFARLVVSCIIGALITFFAETTFNLVSKVTLNATLRMNITSFITITDFILLSRIIKKFTYERSHRTSVTGKPPKLLIIGAGSAAEVCIKEIFVRNNYEIVGLIDDDATKIGGILAGVKVLGSTKDIERICSEKGVDEILVAMPSASQNGIADIVEICEKTNIKTKIIPKGGILNASAGRSITSRARDVQIEDMLSRDPIDLENDKIGEYIEGRKVLVTGGGGSIGSEICRQVIKHKPSKLVILDNYENNAYELLMELKNSFPKAEIEVIIATIRDKIAIDGVFARLRPEIIFHAAAHKHVPLMEVTPKEAVKNNIFGTFNVAKSAIKYGAKRFILISTDKAVNPTNIMGATKRVCEMMVQTFNDKERTEFVAVRFGNVLGSAGSVIPIFKNQIKNGGPVKVTHKDITRYFMTIPEAASLVLQAGTYAQSGEVFVLDMGKPMKIYELAEKTIKLMGYTPGKDMDIEIVGLRPGEKLYEELYMNSENMISTRHKRIYIAEPIDMDKDVFYEKLVELTEKIDNMNDEEVKKCIADITGTYTYEQ